jgi:hypothetical protein
VFVAFDGEEWGLRGSKHYVETTRRWPIDEVQAMVNLDTVGRLHGRKITVLGTGSATEWIHIARGIGFTTGIEAQAAADDLGGSDQRSFLDAGVPAVQIFSGGHEDYHRPTDLPGAIDAAGLIQVAIFVREAVVYLIERDDPLTSTLGDEPGRAAAPRADSSGRRVSLGTLPEFTFPGPGVKVADVIAGSPAETAGLQPGDLIVSIDGEAIADVRAYSGLLAKHAPGDVIRIRVSRGDEELDLEATLVPR